MAEKIMTARKKKSSKRKASRTGVSKKKTARARKSAPRKKSSSASSALPNLSNPFVTGPIDLARTAVDSVTDRLTELVEHAAASTLRRALEGGGREIASWLPQSAELRREAGANVRELREVAGLTIGELAEAVELSDASVLEAVEAGTATLSFELILRLAAVLARHDPVPFILRLVRTYNPVIGQLLEDWGIGRLPLQLEREREFVNILRGHDVVREIPDEDFEQILAFTRSAFETALHFATEPRRPRRS